MLRDVAVSHVGPLSDVAFKLAPRLNVVAGDNGLGKSLILDIVFWAVCGLWPRARATPDARDKNGSRIEWSLGRDTSTEAEREATYDFVRERWSRKTVEGEKPGRRPVIVYAMVDGGFAVFDQARAGGVIHQDDEDFRARRASRGNGYYVFSAEDVFDGLGNDDGFSSNGLIRDWPLWQYRHKKRFEALRAALAALSKGIGEPIKPATPRRVLSSDSREIPWIKLPYGEIPITHASAGMRRIAALAYLLVWAWTEHEAACRLTKTPRTPEILFLFDEVECHLHPRWQRAILPAVMAVIRRLAGQDVQTQIVATTHSPLVLASLEPDFDAAADQLLLVDLNENRKVVVAAEPFTRMGRADTWLTSDMFGLKAAMSAPAEEAVAEAERSLSGAVRLSKDRLRKTRMRLARYLSDTDPMLARMAAMEEAAGAGTRRSKRKPARRNARGGR